MAAVTHLSQLNVTMNATSYLVPATGTFTPAAGDLVLVFARIGATVDVGTCTDSLSLGFTKIGHATFATSAHRVYCFVANALSAGTAMTVTPTVASDAGDGCVAFVVGVSGMSRAGLDAIRQSIATDNQAAAGTPALTFPGVTLTGNVVLGCVGNSTSPATVTPPTSFTETAT